MTRMSWAAGGALVASLALNGWLCGNNRALRSDLAAASQAAPAASTPAEPATKDTVDSESAPPARSGLLGRALGRMATTTVERPEVPEPTPTESRLERRQRRQTEIAAMFGRLDGETEQEYRERMVPFLQTALALPRGRVEDARRAVEEAAGVSPEQRERLDSVLQDAYKEALALTNNAIGMEDVTPYRRNVSGLLNLAGGMGAVLQGSESRISQILSPEQIKIIYDQGFEWGEYIGVSVPWEELNPPPPPPEQ